MQKTGREFDFQRRPDKGLGGPWDGRRRKPKKCFYFYLDTIEITEVETIEAKTLESLKIRGFIRSE
jgi:hypothetical protein